MKMKQIVIATIVSGFVLPGISVANEASQRGGDRSWGFQTTFENQTRLNSAIARNRYKWDRKAHGNAPDYIGGIGAGNGGLIIENVETYQGIQGSVTSVANQTVNTSDYVIDGEGNTINGEILNTQDIGSNDQSGRTNYEDNLLDAVGGTDNITNNSLGVSPVN